MRKPRDYDADLQALTDKTRLLKARRTTQLGELVIACGADGVPVELLAGALLAMRDADTATQEGWRVRGDAFFQWAARSSSVRAGSKPSGAAAGNSGAASL